MNSFQVKSEIDASLLLVDVQGCVTAGPTSGSFACFSAAQIAKTRGVFFVTAHQDDADEIVDRKSVV